MGRVCAGRGARSASEVVIGRRRLGCAASGVRDDEDGDEDDGEGDGEEGGGGKGCGRATRQGRPRAACLLTALWLLALTHTHPC